MKKFLLLTMMVLTVQVSAAEDDFNFGGDTGAYNSGDTGWFNSGDTGSYNSGDTGSYNSGDTGYYSSGDNVMLGGGGGNGAAGAGQGNGYGSEFNRTSPFSSNAGGVPKLSLMGLVMWVGSILNQLVYVIMGAALVAFLYGIFKLSFVDGQKPESREQARKFMFWGIVSLFVMVSVWGLVRILHVTLFGPGDLIIPRLK